jgi:predicted nucleic acid-binding protein
VFSARDFSVIALAERLGAGTLVTLGRRHFAAVAPRLREALVLLP